MPEFNLNVKRTNSNKVRKSINGDYNGKIGRPKGCKLINKVDRSNSNQCRFGHRKVTTSSNKLKDTPIKHGFHLEDYNRICVYAHYYNNEPNPFYIGCGTIQRAFVFKGNRRHESYNNKVKDINLIKVKILNVDIDKETAYTLEEEYISKYKLVEDGGSLINKCKFKTGGTVGRWGKNPNSIPVLQFTKSGKFIKEWSCAKEAGFYLLIDSSSIRKCCRNVPRYHSAGGYVWKYKNGD